MIRIQHPQQLQRLRRLALHAQGLLSVQPFGRGLPGSLKAINHLGYVQLDTISVVERAHHHVLYTRVPGFKPAMTNEMLLSRDIFEYWTHAAALIPIADFRFSLPYKHAIKSGKVHWYKTKNRKLMGELVARIRSDGPLRARDLESGPAKAGGWWDWKPAKMALEQLYMEGDLMVSNRDGFQKTYDLSERILPSSVNTKMPCVEDFATHILDQQLRCHGLVTLKGLTYLRRNPDLRKAMTALVNERLAVRDLEQVELRNGDVFVLEASALEGPLPRLNNRLTILSPFDNSVIQRRRLEALFQYDYQIECYKPAKQREYGYFCLPLLYRGEFVGRMDCKAHRKTEHLEIKSLHWEHPHQNRDEVIAAFVDAVARFCQFQGCNSVALTKVFPSRLLKPVRKALKLLE